MNTTSPWFTSHGDNVGMTSSCSHCIHITLMTSSHLDHDVIVTHVSHDCSLEVHDMSNQQNHIILTCFDMEYVRKQKIM